MEHNIELRVRDRGYLTRMGEFLNKAGKISLLPSVSYTGFHQSCWQSLIASWVFLFPHGANYGGNKAEICLK
jgi:hypothetical protein